MLIRCLLFLALASACSAEPAECRSVVTRQHAIRLAEPSAEREAAPALGALVAVHWQDVQSGGEPALVCTATRIGRTSYLTARHCVPDDLSAQRVLVGAAELEPVATRCDVSRVASVVHVHAHDSLDLAMLVVAEADADERDQRMFISDRSPELGELAWIAGYGLTESASLGELRALEVRVEGLAESSITVRGLGGGACVGDSGGPLYATRGAGVVLLGVLSTGSASCLGQDQFVDVAKVNTWLESTLIEASLSRGVPTGS